MLKPYIQKYFVWNRYYDYCEFRLKKFMNRLSKETISGKKMIDVGAGECQYKKYFSHLDYVAQDSGVGDEDWDFSQIDIRSDIYNIPVEDKTFDYILCTQVMEHLRYPDKAFAEFSRIIKPGGQLFVTVPFAWKEHQQPYDFFRYTQYSLKGLGVDHGFEVMEMNKIGGKYMTIARMFIDINLTLSIRNKYFRYMTKVLFYPFKFLIGFVAYYLDILDRRKDLTIQYEVIYRRQ